MNNLLIIVFIFASVIIVWRAFTMSNSKSTPICIFSGMENVKLTNEGKPVINAKILLEMKWKNSVGDKFETYTDDNGYFSLPSKWDDFEVPAFTTLAITQYITVFIEDAELDIWNLGKTGSLQYDEFNGNKSTNIRCELTEEPRHIDLDSGSVLTSCHWDIQNK